MCPVDQRDVYLYYTFDEETPMFERPKTDFLFASGSVLIGAGSIFNIAGSYFEYNASSSDEAADARAIGSDWAMVGQDIRDALDRAPSELSVNICE